jgi:formamidopyrimidine-DNA glycosylase
MPELPEVETIRRDLDKEVVGRRVDLVEISGARTVRRHETSRVAEAITGQTVTATRRIGKFLLVDFDNNATMAAHLRMSGQLLWTTDLSRPLVKHTHARIRFDHREELRFVDPRTFGELWVTSPDVPELSHLGPDALNELNDWRILQNSLSRRRSPLKAVLLNQQVVAGIGNIYGDEILWTARLHPLRPANEVNEHETQRLVNAMHSVLHEAIAARGSSLRDQQYVDLYGLVGAAQREHKVHDREGGKCLRNDGGVVKKIVVGGRSAYFCTKCQP